MATVAVPQVTSTVKLDSAASANSGVLRDAQGGITVNAVTTGASTNSGAESKARTAAKTAEYTITTPTNGTGGDCVVLCDTTSGGFAVNLPLASTMPGQHIIVKKISNDANSVTVTRAGSDTIEDGTTMVLNARRACGHFLSDGSSVWYCLRS